ncbi:MAG TPA: KTSC domain-containing protein [Candidatus Sulfotelmatobacter sp.]|nr:KTSC domain-containing protein [Candidatus Sulfotelmatobacter sp.]
MRRVAVLSSTIRSVGYEPTTHELEVEFRSREIYVYHDVPPERYDGLMRSESRGTYFNKHIRDEFRFTRT